MPHFWTLPPGTPPYQCAKSFILIISTDMVEYRPLAPPSRDSGAAAEAIDVQKAGEEDGTDCTSDVERLADLDLHLGASPIEGRAPRLLCQHHAFPGNGGKG